MEENKTVPYENSNQVNTKKNNKENNRVFLVLIGVLLLIGMYGYNKILWKFWSFIELIIK
ncbi:MAG: hypothetical protein K0Q97_2470 [Bacillota bacterium]|jgi:hypothetical protein|nr:hypothetical protein [Bacillota bacterium]